MIKKIFFSLFFLFFFSFAFADVLPAPHYIIDESSHLVKYGSYINDAEVIDVDYDSFVSLSTYWWKDKNNVYCKWKVVDWVDVNSFGAVNGLTYIYADDNNFYHRWCDIRKKRQGLIETHISKYNIFSDDWWTYYNGVLAFPFSDFRILSHDESLSFLTWSDYHHFVSLISSSTIVDPDYLCDFPEYSLLHKSETFIISFRLCNYINPVLSFPPTKTMSLYFSHWLRKNIDNYVVNHIVSRLHREQLIRILRDRWYFLLHEYNSLVKDGANITSILIEKSLYEYIMMNIDVYYE